VIACDPAEPAFEWAVVGSALEGDVSGDLHLVVPGSPRSLLAVIDGLGHGPDARRAADECAALLRANAEAGLLDLVRECHAGLRSTRGVAMTIAHLDASAGLLEWLAVGNVEGIVLHQSPARVGTRDAVIQRGGVVGYRLPPLKVSHVALDPGDLIVFATDGVRSHFAEHIDSALSAHAIAEDIATRFSKGSDDALVLVLRVGGVP
jgi:phosphoserine phosphatase RsbX